MCQLVIFLPYISYWTSFREANTTNQNFGLNAKQCNEIILRTCTVCVCVFCSHGWGMAAVSQCPGEKHISDFNWRVPYRKFKELKTLPLKCLGKDEKLNGLSDFQTYYSFVHINKKVMHSFSFTRGLKTLSYWGNWIFFFVHQGQFKTELQCGDTNGERICRIKHILSASVEREK